MHQGNIPGHVCAELRGPHLPGGEGVPRDELLQPAPGEHPEQPGPQVPLGEHGEHHGLGDESVLLGRARTQFPEKS